MPMLSAVNLFVSGHVRYRFVTRCTKAYDFTSPREVTSVPSTIHAKHGEPALCGSHPLVTPYYCRLVDLLCFVLYVCNYCVFLLSVYVPQYFDTVGWVFWPVKAVSHITYTQYTVLVGT